MAETVVYPVSEWYRDLGSYGFPTLFIALRPEQIAALVAGHRDGDAVQPVIDKLNHGIKSLPGKSFVHADVCAPTDSPTFETCRGAAGTGQKAWDLLRESPKVRAAFEAGQSTRIGLHPYRRMDPVREFRLFIRDGELKAVSQMELTRHYARLDGRKTVIWRRAGSLVEEIRPWLPDPTIVMDVYLTSKDELMVIDFNCWGPPTNPLLLKDWGRDWSAPPGLKLIPPPLELDGNVQVSP